MEKTQLQKALMGYQTQVLPVYQGASWFEEAVETRVVSRFLDLVALTQDVCERHSLPGHITGSALLVDPQVEHVALTYHGKLKQWMQFGGHVEPLDRSPLETAQRETQEESGCARVELFSAVPVLAFPFDMDIHEIPALGLEPPHLHFDMRFLFYTDEKTLQSSSESEAVRWFSFPEAFHYTGGDMLRILKKALWWREQGFLIPSGR